MDPKVLRIVRHGLQHPAQIGQDPAEPYYWEHRDSRGFGIGADPGPAIQSAVARWTAPDAGTPGLGPNPRDPKVIADFRALYVGALLIADKLSTAPPLDLKNPTTGERTLVVGNPQGPFNNGLRPPSQYAAHERHVLAQMMLQPFDAIGKMASVMAANGKIAGYQEPRRLFTTDDGPVGLGPKPVGGGGGGGAGQAASIAGTQAAPDPVSIAGARTAPDPAIIGILGVDDAIFVAAVVGVIVVGGIIYGTVHVMEHANDVAKEVQITNFNNAALARAATRQAVYFDQEAKHPGAPLDATAKEILAGDDVMMQQLIAKMPTIEHPQSPIPTGEQTTNLIGKVILWGGLGFLGYKLLTNMMSKKSESSSSSPHALPPPVAASETP